MTQYSSLNAKLSNSQLNKLKSAIKNKTDAVLRILSSMIGKSNDKTNFPHQLLLTNKQVANLRKDFSNNSSTNIKLSKTQLSKMIQSGGFLGRLLGLLLKTGLPLIKNVVKPLAKSVLIPLGLIVVASAADGGIDKILGSGNTTLTISNNEMEDIIRIVQYFEDSGLLIKWVRETIQNKVKGQKGGFFSMLLGTLGASLSRNMLAGNGILRAGYGSEKGKGIIRAGYGNKMGF